MKIKVGDKIKVSNGLEGTVYSISIALDYHDKKAEYGIEVQTYDTELDYIGTVSYEDESKRLHWTYFNQILSVIPQEDMDINKYIAINNLFVGGSNG
jgi:hypothetical protein